ncbi:hypothetical protein HXX76_014137 [Chlamydomonas incerta]|uniref:Uncharacterized protein n=1 Tax=Chlamydomonas incerta TaxID=51695 RepID=A0A835VTI8_CHLIN|nr:hypothetical protein HXX76_014137 [Chlamydomonas incerta]|eukprot:KAG2424979.1 hypothetical protein HXX76_014137 [Chlamydomonas incerta]
MALQPKHALVAIACAAAINAVVYVLTHLLAWHITHKYVTRGSYTRGGGRAYVISYLAAAAGFCLGAACLVWYSCKRLLPYQPMTKVLFVFFLVAFVLLLLGLVLDLWLLGRFNESHPSLTVKHKYPGPLSSVVTLMYNGFVAAIIATVLILVYQPMGGSTAEGGVPFSVMTADVLGRIFTGGPGRRRSPRVCDLDSKRRNLLSTAQALPFLSHGFVADLEVEVHQRIPADITYEGLYRRLVEFVSVRLSGRDDAVAAINTVMVAFTNVILEGCPPDQVPEQEGGWRPPQAQQANEGGRSPPQAQQANEGGRSPPQAQQANEGGRSPPQAQQANEGGRSPPQAQQANEGGRIPPQAQQANEGGRSPPQAQQANMPAGIPSSHFSYIDTFMGVLLAGWLVGVAAISRRGA